MKKLRAFAALPLLTAACCASVPEPQPSPAPTPVATPAPTPAPAPLPVVQQPAYENWLDAPQTPGNWSYRQFDFATQAAFGQGENVSFFAQCVPDRREVALARPIAAEGELLMRIRTETAQRALTARAAQYGSTAVALVALPARDPLLDAIALSRGRFAVETSGFETLYLPAWPEITRVIEDCR